MGDDLNEAKIKLYIGENNVLKLGLGGRLDGT